MEMSKDRSVGFASVRTSKKISRIINHYLKPYNITSEQWSVLTSLMEANHIAQKELAVIADKDQATLTKILDLLEKNQFVKRNPNPSDRRSYLISITEKGTKLFEDLFPYVENIFSKILEGIHEEDLLVYLKVLNSLEKNLDNSLKDM